MAKEKKSFFERLTGSIKVDDEREDRDRDIDREEVETRETKKGS